VNREPYTGTEVPAGEGRAPIWSSWPWVRTTANLVFVPQEIAGNGDINAQHIVFRKHQPGIDDQDLFSILEDILRPISPAPKGMIPPVPIGI
jgi:hypothetical protein